jgi:hypothetical protein
MQAIPPGLQARFEDHLRSKAIPDPLVWSYRKWLRYMNRASLSLTQLNDRGKRNTSQEQTFTHTSFG